MHRILIAIVADDLTDNDRLVELYVQAVRRRLWEATDRDFIEFVNRASQGVARRLTKLTGKTVPVADRTPVARQHFAGLRKPYTGKIQFARPATKR